MDDIRAQLDRVDIMSRIDELTSLLDEVSCAEDDYVDECIRARISDLKEKLS